MKVLIIGASGLLGRPVVNRMNEQGFSLRLFSRTIRADGFPEGVEIVQGDVFDADMLHKAMQGCDAVHISFSGLDEAAGTRLVVRAAKESGIGLISYVSGCTVSEENRWFSMVDQKLQAEQIIKESGIPYLIFRPTWFFESLGLMVRNGKATLLGKQPNSYHWVAADDFAQLIVKAYLKAEALNHTFFVYGPETFTMREALERYIAKRHPEIRKVSGVPLGMLNVIATLSGNKTLKAVIPMFAYFEKVQEPTATGETERLLGKAETLFEEWLLKKR